MPINARGRPAPDHDVRVTWLRERLRTGLWFIPSMAIVAAMVVSSLVRRLDEALGGDEPAFLAFSGSPALANEVLSTIAGSTLTFTGIVFSITAVALQLGSSQFSPRILRTFLRDRGTQWTLGVLVATFTYALFTLRGVNIDATEDEVAVPGLAVSLALGLVLASLLVFVYFVDHLVQSIRVVSIIERVAGEAREAIRESIRDEAPGPPPSVPARPPDLVLTWDRGPAVVVGFDEDDIVAVARAHRVVLRFIRRVGDFVPSGAPAVEVWRDPPDPGTPAIGRDELSRAVLRHVGGGTERTNAQDPMFGFRQLVDIAEKALSPALNDPTTAVQAIDRIHDLLRRIAVRPQPTGVHLDVDGVQRLVVPTPRWDDYVRLACDEIRHYGASSVQVVRRMRAMLEDLALVCDDGRRVVLRAQVELLDRAADAAFPDPVDRAVTGQADHQGLGT